MPRFAKWAVAGAALLSASFCAALYLQERHLNRKRTRRKIIRVIYCRSHAIPEGWCVTEYAVQGFGGVTFGRTMHRVRNPEEIADVRSRYHDRLGFRTSPGVRLGFGWGNRRRGLLGLLGVGTTRRVVPHDDGGSFEERSITVPRHTAYAATAALPVLCVVAALIRKLKSVL